MKDIKNATATSVTAKNVAMPDGDEPLPNGMVLDAATDEPLTLPVAALCAPQP